MLLPKRYRKIINLIFSKKETHFLLLHLGSLLVGCFLLVGLINSKVITNHENSQKFSVLNRQGKVVPSEITVNKYEDNTYSYRVENKYSKIQINKANLDPAEKDNFIFTDAPSGSPEDKGINTSVVFVDDTNLRFESAEVTLKKTPDSRINAVLTCPTWNFDKEKGTCSKWEVSDIKPTLNKDSIAFNVDHFSAYAGAYLEILNLKTNLTKGDTWEVKFNTYGTSDLTIEAVDGTVYGTDVKFLNFYCGETEIPNVYQNNKVFIPNYSCDGQLSHLVDQSVTFGHHHLQFTYGDTVAQAENFACDVGTLSTTCEVSTSQPNANGTSIVGSGNLLIHTGGNLTTLAGEFFSINMGGNVTIESGGNISGNLTTLTAANLDVQLGGNINVNTKGFAATSGTGEGADNAGGFGAGGAGYGGAGGTGNSAGGITYGSISLPVSLGSGGGNTVGTLGGAGGGAVILNITGTTTVSGSITANGGVGATTSGRSGGGGSGGTVSITTGILAGSGSITANGGASGNTSPSGGGGGGGRIALYYTTRTHNGAVQAGGGTGPDSGLDGAAGTIYQKPSSQTDASLTIDNSGKNPETATQLLAGSYTFNTLNVTGGAFFGIQDGVTVSITTAFNPTGTYTLSNTSTTGTITYPTLDLTTTGTAIIIGGGTKWPLRDITVSTGTFSLNGIYSVRDVVIQTGAVLTHQANAATQTFDLQLTTSGNLTINGTGSINTNAKGFAATSGTGQGTDNPSGFGGGGAGYGGAGGTGSSAGGISYGSVSSPVSIGSGGGNAVGSAGGAGGGAVILNIAGTLTISSTGSITANGAAGATTGGNPAGGGSGGTVSITTGVLAGSGSITANGGAGANLTDDAGGGGGGRIALYYTTKTHNGAVQAAGGTGSDAALDGGAGTIFEKPSAQTNPNLTIDNSGKNPDTATQLPTGSYTFDTLNVTGGAFFGIQDGVTVSVTTFNPTGTFTLSNISTTGTITYPTPFDLTTTGTDLIIGGGTKWPFRNITVSSGSLTITGDYSSLQDILVSTGTLSLSGIYSVRDVVIQTGAVLTHQANAATQTFDLQLTASGNVTINGTGSINVNAKGFAATSGPGQGTDNPSGDGGGGAGYGGAGGTGSSAGGVTYGSVSLPVSIGSGGGNAVGGSAGGAGGGAVILNITGTLTVSSTGSITANGAAGATTGGNPSGGGSGGTVSITTGVLAGSGSITANGGAGGNSSDDAGGGGGGRIALYYTTKTFNGATQAIAGTGPDAALDGAPGTIYEKPSAQTNPNMTVDNTGRALDTAFQFPAGSYTFNNFNLKDTFFSIQNGVTISVTNAFVPTGNLTLSNISTTGTITFAPSDIIVTGTVLVIGDGTKWSQFRDITVSSGSLTMTGDFSGLRDVILTTGTISWSGTYSLANLTLQTGTTLSHPVNATTQVNDLEIIASGNVTINGTGAINTNAKGYASTSGTGQGTDGTTNVGAGGAGYGGAGGNGQSGTLGGSAYGSSTNPTDIGSGGGLAGASAGGIGGGAVKLTVAGTLTISSTGSITANGAVGVTNGTTLSGGGGSGGSIYITANTLAGSGGINANGGAGGNGSTADGGGGSGGRISVFSATSTYSGSITVTGGLGPDAATDGATGTTFNDLSSPTATIDAVCGIAGNSCTVSGTAASPQQAFNVTSLTGTASEPDTSLTALQISIKDVTSNFWYNPGTNSFNQSSELLFPMTSITPGLPFTGTVNWTLNTTGFPFVIDHTYTIRTAPANTRITGTQTLNFIFSNSPPTVSNVTASQSANGTVPITYDVTDNELPSTTIYLLYDIGITLASTIGTGTGGIDVSDATFLPASGTIMINDEMISYTGKTGNTLNGTITRGANNTAIIGHTSGAVIWGRALGGTGAVGTVTNGTGKLITWTAKTDLNGYRGSVRVQVTSNDGASSSMIGSAQSSSFALDVKNPLLTGNFRIDASIATPLIYVPCSDDATLQMRLGTASNLAGSTLIPYAASTGFAGTGVSYSNGMTLYGQCQDAFSNTTAIQIAVVPGIPSNIFFQDVSNPSLNDWREFIAWGVVDATAIAFDSYKIYRSDDGGPFNLITSIPDRQTNFFVDQGLSNTVSYTYKLNAVDANGSLGPFSGTVTDIPDGSGGTDLSVPTIANVVVSNITPTGATITWDTNKFSDSNVFFEATGTYPGGNSADYDSSQGAPSFVTSHSVILHSLTPNTIYSFLAQSTDAGSNTATSSNASYQFTTLSGPIISNVSVTQAFDTQATITWKTDIPATSDVIYSKNSDLSSPTFTTGSTDLVTEHSVTLINLDVGSVYYFYVRSTDASANTTEDKNVVNGSVQYYTFSTTIDVSDPVITNVQTTLVGESGVTITWTTDEQANSRVLWGPTPGLGNQTTPTTVYTTEHSVSITGLTPLTQYYYQVASIDRSGNETIDGTVHTFTTNDVTTVVTPPTPPPSDDDLQNQISDTLAELIRNASQDLLETILAALQENDSLSDLSEDSLTEFLTQLSSQAVSGPTIGGSNLTIVVGSTTAVVSWVTDRPSNSLVAYVKADAYDENSSNPYAIETGNSSESVTEHSVTVEGLAPETTYHIQARSKGSFGPVSNSGDNVFTTTSLTADINNIRIEALTETSVTLAWDTSIPTRSKIIITDTTTGLATTYDNASFLTAHTFTTDDLNPSTNYTAQVISIDEKGKETESSIISFATVLNTSPPAITDVRVVTSLIPGKVEQVQTIISWTTNKPSTSKVLYDEGVRPNGELRLSVPEDPAFRRDHLIISSSFTPGKVYSYRVTSTDTGGNTGASQNYTLLTPRPRESIIDLIVKNLEEMFGFLR